MSEKEWSTSSRDAFCTFYPESVHDHKARDGWLSGREGVSWRSERQQMRKMRVTPLTQSTTAEAVRLTEGPLKADVVSALDPDKVPTLGLPGRRRASAIASAKFL